MVSLPSSIEQYLTEAGFSATEIMVLKKLLEGKPLTLRELAAKTGKSSGVLTQATKKMMERGVVSKESINDQYKYAISSLSAITDWVENDMKQQHEALNRKKQNFDAFISTVQREKNKPDMEFYEGLEGIKQAFNKLLDYDEDEWLLFTPALLKEEDDPLAKDRIEYFRERKRKNIFVKALAPNTPLGRRYHCSDVYRNRQTRLVASTDFPVSFEKYVIGDTVACIDTDLMRASFIHYPHLAESQRKLFGVLWRQAKDAASAPEPEKKEVPIAEKVLKGLRTCFFCKKGALAIAGMIAVAGVLTWGIYLNNSRIQTERIREQVKAIATTAVPLFSDTDINQLRTEDDINLPAYERVVSTLDQIRRENEDVKYVYIVRPTDIKNMYEFAADSYGLDLDKGIDFNDDGVIGPEDEIPLPGMDYDVSEIPGAVAGMKEAYVDEEPFTDQWGTFISGFAPIRNKKGEAIAVLGVDKMADRVRELILESFSPIYIFILFFFACTFIYLLIVDTSLINNMIELTKQKHVIFKITICLSLSVVITLGLFIYSNHLNTERIRERVKAIAATAAPHINGDDVEKIVHWTDHKKPEYESLIAELNDIRERNPEIVYSYIMRLTDDKNFFRFVVDADSLDLKSREDLNDDGLVNDMVAPGQLWIDPYPEDSAFMRGFKQPSADSQPTPDEWGVWISGHAPIKNTKGEVVAIIGVDMYASDVEKLTKDNFSSIRNIIGFFVLLIVITSLPLKSRQ